MAKPKTLSGSTIFRLLDLRKELTEAEIVSAVWRAAEQKKINRWVRLQKEARLQRARSC